MGGVLMTPYYEEPGLFFSASRHQCGTARPLKRGTEQVPDWRTCHAGTRPYRVILASYVHSRTRGDRGIEVKHDPVLRGTRHHYLQR
jgi:hypothetical protein